MAGDAVPDNIRAAEAWLARSRQCVLDGSRFQWSIDYPGLADGVGTIALSVRTPEVSFVVGRRYWGRGIATEAAQTILSYGFGSLNLETVRAEVASRNKMSLSVLTKLGFKHVRTFVDESDGERCEELILHMLQFSTPPSPQRTSAAQT